MLIQVESKLAKDDIALSSDNTVLTSYLNTSLYRSQGAEKPFWFTPNPL